MTENHIVSWFASKIILKVNVIIEPIDTECAEFKGTFLDTNLGSIEGALKIFKI